MLEKKYLKDDRGSLADYNRVIQLDPYDVYTYTNRGNLKYKRNDRAGAIEDVNQSTRLFQQHQNTLQYGWAIELLRQWQSIS